MHFLLTAATWATCGFLVTRIPFVKKSGIDNRFIFLLFSLKVAAGMLLGMVATRYSPVNDYVIINNDGIHEYRQLITRPFVFFTDLFQSHRANGYSGFFSAVNSYWNDLRNTLITKILAFCNLVSRGDFDTNVVFLNVAGIIGQVAVFRVFDDLLPGKRNWLIALVFLTPTSLFYTSCIHKDLFAACFLGLYVYAVYFSLKEKVTLRRTTLLLLSFAGILLMRNFMAMVLIPATAGFILSEKKKWHPGIAFSAAFGITLLIVWTLHFSSAGPDFLQIIADRQTEFLKLPVATSQIELTTLEPTPASFLSNLPEAILHGFARPYLWESSDPLIFLTALEWSVVFVIPFLLALVVFRSRLFKGNPFLFFCILISFSMFLMIGYIIPNTHSIVRYRSLFLPFVSIPILSALLKLKKE